MRVLVLAVVMMASAALAGCQAGPPPSAGTRQPVPAAGQADAELPPIGTDTPANLDTNGRNANGPPVNLLQPRP